MQQLRSSLRWLVTLAIACLAIAPNAVAASSGQLDPTFAGGGMLIETVGEGDGQIMDVAIQGDGRIVSAGRTIRSNLNAFGVTRHLPSGARDESFGAAGFAQFQIGSTGDSQANAVEVASDGSVWLAGYAYGAGQDFALMKLRPDGTPDTSFAGTGSVVTDFSGSEDTAYGLAVQPDGRVLVGGYTYLGGSYDYLVARYMPDGTLDTSFSSDGWMSTEIDGTDLAVDLALLPDGRILLSGASGTGMSVARYRADGSPDTTFGAAGEVTVPFSVTAYAFDVQPLEAGAMALAGYAWNTTTGRLDPTVVRLRENGSVDTAFAEQGVLRLPSVSTGGGYAYDAVLDPDGGLLISGVASTSPRSDAFLARVLPDGRLDAGWGNGGIMTIDSNGDADQSLCLGLDAAGNAVVCIESTQSSVQRWGLARVVNTDRTPPTAPTIGARSHLPGDFSSIRDLVADIGASKDAWSGVAGYSWAIDQQPGTQPDAVVEPGGPASAVLSDGDWYVHARAVDRVGNVGPSSTFGPFRIDTTAPSIIWSGSRSTRRSGSVRLGAVDAGSGVVRVEARFLGKRVPIRGGVIRIRDMVEGRGVLSITARDRVGLESVMKFRMVIDRTAPSVRSVRQFVLGPVAAARVTDAVSGVRKRTQRVLVPRVGRNVVSLRVSDRAGNGLKRRFVVVRRLSLAHPSLNRGLKLRRGGGGSISASTSWVNNAFRFVSYNEPWYAREDHGPALVREAQWRLQRLGFMSMAERRTGILDLQTIRAVQRYQRARKLPPLGTIGPRTRKALDRDVLKWGRRQSVRDRSASAG